MSFRIITVCILLSIVSAWSCNNDIDLQNNHRIVIAAFDGLSDYIFRNEEPATQLKTIHKVAESGVFAEGMVTAFPGVTTNGHAALYTGTFGNKNGITSGNLRLPRAEHTIFDHRSGFHSSLLRVEPIWVTAARQGKKVLAIQATQMYPFLDHVTASDAPTPPALVTGYGPSILSYPRMITPQNAAPQDTQPDIPLPDSELEPKIFSWSSGPFDIVAAITSDAAADGYNRFWINAGYDVNWVGIPLHREETQPPVDRPLARYFSDDVFLPADDGSIKSVTNYRLYELSNNGENFLLFQPAFHEVAIHDASGNEEQVVQALYRNAGGFIGNGPSFLWRDGVLGTQLYAGGDGTAERRYLEGVELLIRQSNRYTEWLTEHYNPDLLLDYSPYPDETDHWFYGFVRTDITGFDREMAQEYDYFRSWTFAALNQRAAILNNKAGSDGHILFVADHGMSAAHKRVYVNEILRRHGFLETDTDNNLIQERVQAYHIRNSYGIIINTTDWKDGIVPPEERATIREQVIAVLRNVKDPDTGERIFTEFFRSEEYDDSLGIGGEANLDLYYDMAPGYVHSAELGSDGIVEELHVPIGAHSFAPTRPEMLSLFTARGPAWGEPKHLSTIRIVDIYLLVCELLGIQPHTEHVGRPLDEYVFEFE